MTPRYHPPNPDLQQSPGRLASHTPNTRHESVVSTSSSSHQFVVGAGRKPLEPRLSRGKCLASALASILSLVTILAVLALCRTSQRRLDSGGAVRRSLSDTEDDREQSEIVEQCLDLEQELGLPVAASAYGEEASEATSRIVAMLYDSAAAFEQMRVLGLQKRQDGAHSPPPKLPRLHQAGPPALYSQGSFGSFWPQSGGGLVESVVGALDADAWVTDDSELVFGEGEQQRHMAKPEEVPGLQRKVSSSQSYPLALYEGDSKPSAALSLGKPNSAEPGLSPKGWIDGSSSHTDEEAVLQGVDDTAWRQATVRETPHASTSAGSVATLSEVESEVSRKVPHVHVGQASTVFSSPIKAVHPLDHREHAVILDGLRMSASAAAARATSSGGGEPCWPGDIRLHPFVRLPVVNPNDIPRSFSEEFALSLDLSIVSPMESYMKMRNLFAKASLTAEDAGTLMTEAELLASYAAHKLAKPPTQCAACHIVTKLSSMFMVFDYLVCTIEVLGKKMNTDRWWTKFAQKFHTDYLLPEASRTLKGNVLNNLVNRLSAALSIYKEGRRPEFEEIIDLKRAIFAHAPKNSQLANPLWNLWKQDDQEFSSSSGHIESPSDSKGQGQR